MKKISSFVNEPNMESETALLQRYEYLLVNMKTIAKSYPGDKFTVKDERYLVRDTRYLQSFWRRWTGDNRTAIIDFLRKMVQDIQFFIRCPEQLAEDNRSRLIQILPSFRSGLDALKATYSDCRITLFTLEHFTDSVDSLVQEIHRNIRKATRNPPAPG